MHIRKLFCLTVLFCINSACNKDKNTRHYSGVVINGTHNTPIADAAVNLFVNRGSRMEEKHVSHTDSKGQYAFNIDDKNLEKTYALTAEKDNLLLHGEYVVSNKLNNDTIWLDDPSYLRIIVKATHSPMPYQYKLIWNLWGPQTILKGWPGAMIYHGPLNNDTMMITYPYRLFNTASIYFIYQNGFEPFDTLFRKVQTLQPLTTTEVRIDL